MFMQIVILIRTFALILILPVHGKIRFFMETPSSDHAQTSVTVGSQEAIDSNLCLAGAALIRPQSSGGHWC